MRPQETSAAARSTDTGIGNPSRSSSGSRNVIGEEGKSFDGSGRTPSRRTEPSDGSGTWVTLRGAAEQAGVSVSKVRGLYRAGRVRSRKPADWTHKESTERHVVTVVLEDVLAQLGSARRETGALDPPPSNDVRTPTATAIDPDEWSRITAQLEELRRTRDEVAAARERAARAEEERDTLEETLGEIQPRLERLERLSAAVDSTGSSAGDGNSADGVMIPDPDVEVEWTVEEPEEPKEAPRFSFLQRDAEDRWRAFTARISSASPMLAERLLTRWDHLAESTDLRWSRITLRSRNGWHRFGDAAAASRTRFAEAWPRWASVLRRPIVFGGIVVAVLCILSGIALLRARTGTTPAADETHQDAVSSLTDDRSFATGFDPSPTASTVEEGLPGVDVHVNEAAGYLFSYPASWAISREAGVDRLRDPSGDVLMAFEVAPPGTLRSASDRVVGEIAARYSDVELETSPVEQTPQGLPSVVVGGHGVGPGRATTRFLVITIQAPDGNRAITVHFSPDARPLEWLPVIREVIASYRISTLD
jgi:hypothetical protein